MDPLEKRRTRPAQSNAQLPLRETASQTAGPYVHIGCMPNMAGVEGVYPKDLMTNANAPIENPIIITGQVFEGEGVFCGDVMLEFWQADEDGDYASGLWHRAGTNLNTGIFRIETAMPGAFADQSGAQLAPFINVWITARGINIGLLTRIYFPDHRALHADDPHLALVDESRRDSLMAKPTSHANEYRFDVHLQGETETVFFDV